MRCGSGSGLRALGRRLGEEWAATGRVRVAGGGCLCDSVQVDGPGSESCACLSADSGRGAAWLARLTGGQEVAGSNPVAPTGWKWLVFSIVIPPVGPASLQASAEKSANPNSESLFGPVGGSRWGEDEQGRPPKCGSTAGTPASGSVGGSNLWDHAHPASPRPSISLVPPGSGRTISPGI